MKIAKEQKIAFSAFYRRLQPKFSAPPQPQSFIQFADFSFYRRAKFLFSHLLSLPLSDQTRPQNKVIRLIMLIDGCLFTWPQQKLLRFFP